MANAKITDRDRVFDIMFHAYEGEQRDLRWVSVTLTSIATILLLCRLSATIKNRGWLGLEDALVIVANVRTTFRHDSLTHEIDLSHYIHHYE